MRIDLDWRLSDAYIPLMVDPVRTLLLEIEEEIAKLPGASLVKTRVAGPRSSAKSHFENDFENHLGRLPPPGFAAFYARYDGGTLGPSVRLLSWAESARKVEAAARGGTGHLKGLWPVLERGTRLFALDAEAATGEAEWPVVEVADRSVDRAGTTFLHFLYALLADLHAPDRKEPLALARELARRDPGLAVYWVELVEELERAGHQAEVGEALARGLGSANPLGPALLFAVGLRAYEAGDDERAWAAFDDAFTLEPQSARDDDARLDAAAIRLALAAELPPERRDKAAVDRARVVLGAAAASTGAYWRGEAIRAMAEGRTRLAALAMGVVKVLLSDDADTARIEAVGPRSAGALGAIVEARDALDRGANEEAVQRARAAIASRPDLGVAYAVLAEALNAQRDRGALEAAQRATELNPALVDAWRELGDAHLEARQADKAEIAYRKVIARDDSYGLGHAKLAQALLEQGRTLEALDAINAATERGGDAFFLAAVRGDILAEMSRHDDAAEAYDQALRAEPEDHWVLHQAAIEHSRAGNNDRAAELFQRAMEFDQEGCHQTLIDYGDLLRRVGRIGDAVRLYRKAVQASPNESEWRQVLREAERELMAAPN